MKMDEPHVVPLTPTALAILRSLPRRLGDEHGYVLGQAIHYGRAKQLLDARITALNGGKPLPHWTLHDLRRTFRTGLSALKIPPHICEMAIAHGKRGVARIYDQFRYADEVRAAFEAWERRLLSIVTPAPAPDSNVVKLRKAS
jgi:integrase